MTTAELPLAEDTTTDDQVAKLPLSPPARIHSQRNRRRPSLATPLYPNSPLVSGERFVYPESMPDDSRKLSVFSSPGCEAPVMLPMTPLDSSCGEKKNLDIIPFRSMNIHVKTLAVIITVAAAALLATTAVLEFIVNEPNIVFTSIKAVPWIFYTASVLTISYGLFFEQISPIRWTIRIAGYPTCFLAVIVTIISTSFSIAWSLMVLIGKVGTLGDKINMMSAEALALGWLLSISGFFIYTCLKYYIKVLKKVKDCFRFIGEAKLAGLENLNLENGVGAIAVEMPDGSENLDVIPEDGEADKNEEKIDLTEVLNEEEQTHPADVQNPVSAI